MKKGIRSMGMLLMAAALVGGTATSASAQWERNQIAGSNPPDLYDVHFMDAQNGLAAGEGGIDLEDGVVFRTTNGGETWLQQHVVPGSVYQTGWMLTSDKWVVGGYDSLYNAEIMYTDNGGTTWGMGTLPSGGMEITRVMFTDDMTGYAIGEGFNTYALKTTDGGETWSTAGSRSGFAPFAMGFADENTGYVSGSDATEDFFVYMTTDGGVNWTDVSDDFDGLVTAIHWSDENTGYIATAVLNLLGETEEVQLYKTSDKGANWTKIATITSGGDEYGVVDMEFVSATDGFILFYEDEASGIKKTTDGGVIWADMTTGLGNNEVYNAFDFPDASHGVAVGEDGVYGLYSDGSTSIAPLAGKHNLNVYPNPVNSNTFTVNMGQAVRGTATLTDMTGRIVWSDANLNLREGQNTIALPYDALQQGVYHLNITSAGAVYGSRLSVVK